MLLWNFVFFTLFAASSAAAEIKFPFTARVKTDHVNIRAGQSNNYEALLEVNTSDELVVVGKAYSWYKVQLPENSRIFVKADYTRSIGPQLGEVTADRLNIRCRADTDATIIGRMVRGEQFFIKEAITDKGGWLWIRPVPQAYGWVHEKLLEFKSHQILYHVPDPKDAAQKARADHEAAERKRALKFSVLKPVTADQYEAQGTLAVAEAGAGAYKLLSGVKGDTCIAYLEGPSSMLGNFVGTRVVVRGAARDDISREAVVMTVVRINLAL